MTITPMSDKELEDLASAAAASESIAEMQSYDRALMLTDLSEYDLVNLDSIILEDYGDWFAAKLMRCLDILLPKADSTNLIKLRNAYPGACAAYLAWYNHRLFPTAASERAFHLTAIADSEKVCNEKDELIFPAAWIRMWIAFDRRLIADVERLTAERGWYKEHYGIEDKAAERYAAQLAEAVGLLHLSPCIGRGPHRNADFYCWMNDDDPKDYCPRCAFLASLTEEEPNE